MSLADFSKGLEAAPPNPLTHVFFIDRHQIPAECFKDVTYYKFVCSVREQKKEKNRTRGVLGGNRVHFPGNVGTPTADMLLFNLLLNNVVSTPGAKFMAFDVSNFYLNTHMTRYEYVKMRLADIPDEVVQEYGLHENKKITADEFVYVEV